MDEGADDKKVSSIIMKLIDNGSNPIRRTLIFIALLIWGTLSIILGIYVYVISSILSAKDNQ